MRYVLLIPIVLACSPRVIPPPGSGADGGIDECVAFDECESGFHCEASLCVADDFLGGCSDRDQCGAGEVCVAGICDSPPASCANTSECPSPLLCDGFTGNCFDPDALGCQFDDECRFEAGCDDGCICDAEGTCVTGGGPGPGPGGSPVALAGYQLENREHSPPIQSVIMPDSLVMEPGQVLVIGRDASRAEFEAAWGVSLASDVLYINNGSPAAGIPVINGSETWALVSSSGTDIDTTVVGSSGHAYQRSSATDWTETPDEEATPGTVVPGLTGLVISEWSDKAGSGNFHFEFIELYFGG